MENNHNSNISSISIDLNEFIFTPLTCAKLINEIIKAVIYQKNQIPYPYHFMRTAIVRRRERREDGESAINTRNFTVDNHYRIAAKIYDDLECIMKHLCEEITKTTEIVKEVLLVFGTMPHCPREAFSINISSMARGHSENNHLLETERKQGKILREIFLSQKWVDSIDSSLPCTNTFVYLRKEVPESSSGHRDDFFIPSAQMNAGLKCKQTTIHLDYDTNRGDNCCDNLVIFQDCRDMTPCKPPKFVDAVHEELWFEAPLILQGFRDCFIDKISACELW